MKSDDIGENMRILVVGAIKGGTVPIGRAIYSAFREIGQERKRALIALGLLAFAHPHKAIHICGV